MDEDDQSWDAEITDLSLDLLQEAWWIFEYAIVEAICVSRLTDMGHRLLAAVRRASALLFVEVGEVLHRRYAGKPLCASWDELVCHRDAIAHRLMEFRGEWGSPRMKTFAEEQHRSDAARRLEALWDLVRWFDERKGVPEDHDIAWKGGTFFRGERAEPIVSMCNGILFAAGQATEITVVHVETEGARLIAALEAARGKFAKQLSTQ